MFFSLELDWGGGHPPQSLLLQLEWLNELIK